ncbi:MAG: linear amide C-N hydrolase [Eubacteriales bacterium]|nr:linear amide C-N hydrolase [Eubacteriales bacterium]
MCTFFGYPCDRLLGARNMDIDRDFGASFALMQRDYRFPYKDTSAEKISDKRASAGTKYAVFGIATVFNETPLYAEAMNEHGLMMASLNYPEAATYQERQSEALNLAPYEVIPFVLSRFNSVAEVLPELKRLSILAEPFAPGLPLAPLHYILCDEENCIVLEADIDGLHIYENPWQTLTNNPSFPEQLNGLQTLALLQDENPQTPWFAKSLKNIPESQLSHRSYRNYPLGQGFGTLGLPGDLTPAGRFQRAVFYREMSLKNLEAGGDFAVVQAFHILEAVSMPRGAIRTDASHYDETLYSAVLDTEHFAYYLRLYELPQISCCRADHLGELDGDKTLSLEFPSRAIFA